MLTTARIRKNPKPAELNWISGLEDRGHPEEELTGDMKKGPEKPGGWTIAWWLDTTIDR